MQQHVGSYIATLQDVRIYTTNYKVILEKNVRLYTKTCRVIHNKRSISLYIMAHFIHTFIHNIKNTYILKSYTAHYKGIH